MAKQLPVRTAYPDPTAEPTHSAGAKHLDSHVSDLVQAMHWELAYLGADHIDQCWEAAEVRDTTGALVQRLGDWVSTPADNATAIAVRAYVDSDDAANTGTLRVACVEAAGEVDITVPISGSCPAYVTGNLTISRGGTASTFRVSLQSGSAGKYADLLALSIVDSDLAVGGMP